MGVRLAQYALGPWWAHIDPAPRCLLAYMATVAHDNPTKETPAGLFFQSRPTMVLAYTGIDENDPRYASAERRIRRYLATLIDAQAIRVYQSGRRGHRAEYLLLVDPLTPVQESLPLDLALDVRGAESVRNRGAESVPLTTELGGPRVSKRGAESVPQRNNRGTTTDEEPRRGLSTSTSPTPSHARATSRR